MYHLHCTAYTVVYAVQCMSYCYVQTKNLRCDWAYYDNVNWFDWISEWINHSDHLADDLEYLADYLEYLVDFLNYLTDYLEYLADYLSSLDRWLLKIPKPLDYRGLPDLLVAIKCFKYFKRKMNSQIRNKEWSGFLVVDDFRNLNSGVEVCCISVLQGNSFVAQCIGQIFALLWRRSFYSV